MNSTVQNITFNRKVWASQDDFTGSLAKCLIRHSPYTVPANLETCIGRFFVLVGNVFDFSTNGQAEIDLDTLTDHVYNIMESIPEITALGVPINSEDGFIDTMLVAQNITCEIAGKLDADRWLELTPPTSIIEDQDDE